MPTGKAGDGTRATPIVWSRDPLPSWRGVRSEPRFAALVDERDRRFGPRRPFEHSALPFHENALVRAGFSEVGEVWRYHENAILLAKR